MKTRDVALCFLHGGLLHLGSRIVLVTAAVMEARETGLVMALGGLLPPLPQLPAPGPTAPPDIDLRILVDRQEGGEEGEEDTELDIRTIGANTCGFLSDNWIYPWTCVHQDRTCKPSGTALACCYDTGTTNCLVQTKTACIALSETVDTPCPTAGFARSKTLCCTASTALNCLTNLLVTGGSTASVIACAHGQSGLHTLAITPTNHDSYVRFGVDTTAAITSSSSTPVTTAGGSSTDSEDSGDGEEDRDSEGEGEGMGVASFTTASEEVDDQATATAEPEEGAIGVPAGPIAGGVVGGLAVLGIVVALVLCILRRRKRKGGKEGDTTIATPMTAAPGGNGHHDPAHRSGRIFPFSSPTAPNGSRRDGHDHGGPGIHPALASVSSPSTYYTTGQHVSSGLSPTWGARSMDIMAPRGAGGGIGYYAPGPGGKRASLGVAGWRWSGQQRGRPQSPAELEG